MNLQEHAAKAIKDGANCWQCGKTPTESNIKSRPDKNGWDVDGFEDRQWIYFECTNGQCRYQTSFAKLRILGANWPPAPKVIDGDVEIHFRDGVFESRNRPLD
ncbi:MAG: hypothetical protein WD509_02415 [Candidatus Paceibacterota bacterium]